MGLHAESNNDAGAGTYKHPLQPGDADTLDWCLEIGETVLSSPVGAGARSPEEALRRFIDGVEERHRQGAEARMFATNRPLERVALGQRIDRLSMQLRRPRAEVLDWAVCIGVLVLSDPVTTGAGTPRDALAAHVRHSFAAKFAAAAPQPELHGPTWHL